MALVVGVLVVAGWLAAVGWTEARREVHILCGLMGPGTPRAEVERLLSTAELLELQPEGVALATASAFTFDAALNLRSAGCAVTLDEAGVVERTLTPGVRLPRVAAIAGAGLLLYLCAFQIGLATGRISGRRAWGGQHDTLPPALRRSSAVTAALMPLLAWLLLERAGVVDVVGADAFIGGAAWAVVLLFLVSTAGNLASASRAERQLGIPVPAALAVLSFVVAYGI